MATGHSKGEIFCSCGVCPHGNAFQCADHGCPCCVGGGGKPYVINYLKDAAPPATNF